MSAMTNGIKHVRAPWTDDPQTRIAVALEALAGCTGWVDKHGQRQHDGDTCPVHEGEDLTPAAVETGPQSFLDGWRSWVWGTFG